MVSSEALKRELRLVVSWLTVCGSIFFLEGGPCELATMDSVDVSTFVVACRLMTHLQI